MKLPFSFLKKEEKPQYFLALLLRDDKVTAVVFEELLGKAKIIGENNEYFERSIEEISEDELIKTLDTAISLAESSLPPEIESHKTVFGLKETWVEEAKIKKDYLSKLKKVSDSLGLEPIGFLVIQEAISHLLKKEEGAPLSALLVEIGKENIAISIVKGGKIAETKRAKIEDSIVETVDKTLHYFTKFEVLPSRIILFDDKKEDSLQQKFIAHHWSKALPFLHVPQISTLPQGFDAKAVLFGTSLQMGFEILDGINYRPRRESFQEKDGEIETKVDKEEVEEKMQETPLRQGFEGQAKETEESVEEENIEQEEGFFGFIRDVDVADNKEKSFDTKEEIINREEDKEQKDEYIEPVKAYENLSGLNPKIKKNKFEVGKFLKIFSFLFFFIFSLTNIFKKLSFPLKRKKIFFVVPLLFILLIAFFIIYLVKVKADIYLTIQPQTKEQKEEITFTTSKSSDFSKNTIESQFVSITEDGSASTETSGKKEVGEKAKGTITIYNKSSESKNFLEGTIITGPNKLQFTLDKSVTVASASGDFFSPTMGTAKANVTASQIGKESNLPSGTTFTIGGNTNIAAKNDTALQGGSKKEVSIVSKKDADKLLADLPKKLEEKAKQDLQQKKSQDTDVLPVFVDNSLTKKEFNKKVDEEASQLTLNGTIVYQGVSYRKSLLTGFSKSLLEKNSSGMKISENSISYSLGKVKQVSDKEVLLELTIKGSLIPQIETEKVKKEISGKSFEEARKILLTIKDTQDAEIKLIPALPFLPKILPRLSQNIQIITRVND